MQNDFQHAADTPGEPYDAVVVGAGPAGLSAALYLARFRRHTLVVHDGTSRARTIPLTNNVPGFDQGIAGADLLQRMTIHATDFGARVIEGTIVAAKRDSAGFCLTDADGTIHRGRTLLLATGLAIEPLSLPPDVLAAAITAGTVRYCPVCDGFEHRDQRIGVVGDIAHAAGEALFLRTYSRDVTVLSIGPDEVPPGVAAALADKGVRIHHGPLEGIRLLEGGVAVAIGGVSDPLAFDVIYPATGSQPRTELADMLGLARKEDGTLPSGSPFGTPVPGLFATGDIVDGLDQISVAMGQGAVAATRAHNWLREQDGWVLDPAQPA